MSLRDEIISSKGSGLNDVFVTPWQLCICNVCGVGDFSSQCTATCHMQADVAVTVTCCDHRCRNIQYVHCVWMQTALCLTNLEAVGHVLYHRCAGMEQEDDLWLPINNIRLPPLWHADKCSLQINKTWETTTQAVIQRMKASWFSWKWSQRSLSAEIRVLDPDPAPD